MNATYPARVIAVLFALTLAQSPASADIASREVQSSHTDQVKDPREVNVTQGSTPDWLPSEKLEAEAIATWERFNTAVETDAYDEAWAMLGEGTQELLPRDTFVDLRTKSRATNGPLQSRERIKITWTQNGPRVPQPGTYVAIDASATFERAHRHCGYTILFQAPGADEFVIVRTQDVVLDDATWSHLATNNSPLQADLTWRLVSQACPNYSPPSLPDTIADGIEFASVAAAREALEQAQGFEQRDESGWAVFTNTSSKIDWWFAPQGSPYFPSVLKWFSETNDDGLNARVALKCEAIKAVCDAFFTQIAAESGMIPVSFDAAS